MLEMARLACRALLGVVVVTLSGGLMTAGCDRGGSGSASGDPSSTVSIGSPAVSVDPTAEAALTAYRGMWRAWVEASAVSDPDSEDLRDYATGEALKAIVSVLLTNQNNGQISRGEPVIDPSVEEVTDSGVTVRDCVSDENWLMYYQDSGELVDEVPGGRHNMIAAAAQIDGVWKIATFNLGEVGTC